MTQLRSDLPPLPQRMRDLPLDERGYPVPWFVAWIDGKPDFRIIDTPKIALAHNKRLCWVCGQERGRNLAFVIGPMCAVNRIASEPPSHLDCATFAALACPFLTRPQAKRREAGLDEIAHSDAAGIGQPRNPGVALVWVTRSYKPIRAELGKPGVLFQIGDPMMLLWFAQGRNATRAEILASFEGGCTLLRDMAQAEGVEAAAQYERTRAAALQLIPAA